MTSKPTWKYLLSLPSKVTNKYVIAILTFGVWMTFFDKNNIIAQMEYTKKIHELKEQLNYYETGVKQLEAEYRAMMEDQTMFARQYHHMHEPNEDVFVVRYVKPDKNK